MEKNNKKKKKWKIILPVAVVVILVIVFVQKGKGSSEAVQEVETAKAEKGNITAELETSGTIGSEDVRTYSSPVNAEIATANLQVGKPVKKGEPLITFQTGSLEKSYNISQLQNKASDAANQKSLEMSAKGSEQAAQADSKIQSIDDQLNSLNGQISELTAQMEQSKNAATEAGNLDKEITELDKRSEELKNKKDLTKEEQKELEKIQKEKNKKQEQRKEVLRQIEQKLNEKYGAGTVILTLQEQYRNMREKIEPCMEIVEWAREAIQDAGVQFLEFPERGGTDGARLSFMGLPCPNLGTGGYAFHGPYEHVTAEGMDLSVTILICLVKKVSEQRKKDLSW